MLGFFAENVPEFEQNLKKPEKTCGNRRFRLTKRSERMKVKCGTVLRTRMNIDDFALGNWMRFYEIFMRGK
jgi:hypothetical protein